LGIERKLVRDKVPELLMKEGRLVNVIKVSGNELCNLLVMKLKEEVNELSMSLSIEESADILEVLETLAEKCLGKAWNEVVKVKEAKKSKRGGFREGIVVEYIRK